MKQLVDKIKVLFQKVDQEEKIMDNRRETIGKLDFPTQKSFPKRKIRKTGIGMMR